MNILWFQFKVYIINNSKMLNKTLISLFAFLIILSSCARAPKEISLKESQQRVDQDLLKIEKILASPLAATWLGGPARIFSIFLKCSTLHWKIFCPSVTALRNTHVTSRFLSERHEFFSPPCIKQLLFLHTDLVI